MKSLHVASDYRVKYDTASHFCGACESINDLIHIMCPGAWFSDEQKCYSDEIEIPLDEMQKMIKDIENGTEESRIAIEESGTSKEVSVEELVASLKELVDKADPSNYFVRVFWF